MLQNVYINIKDKKIYIQDLKGKQLYLVVMHSLISFLSFDNGGIL